MRRACRRSARMRARVLLPTRKGPSMTMKRGGWGLRCGTRARLAAEESSLGIVGLDRKRSAADGRIIAELARARVLACLPDTTVEAAREGQKCRNIFHIYGLVLPFEEKAN